MKRYSTLLAFRELKTKMVILHTRMAEIKKKSNNNKCLLECEKIIFSTFLMRRSSGTALPDNSLEVSYKNKPIITKKTQQLYSWTFIEEKISYKNL